MTPIIRILIIEDFEPFRRFIRLSLESRADFQIVSEAQDGLEAVQKAKALQPDLVLMDIGLPKLNGIAAAEQIRVLAPHAKVLFVSLESSPAVVRLAFHAGARGYIHKLQAQSDLIPAVQAVVAGRQFVSSSLDSSEFRNALRCHETHFYSDDAILMDRATRFIAGPLKADGAAIVLATSEHANDLVQRLKTETIDVDAAIREGIYTAINAHDALAKIQVNGTFDCDLFFKLLCSLVESAIAATKTQQPRVAIYGECCGLLCAEGRADAALQIEKRGNDLFEMHRVEIMCAYPLSAFQGKERDRESISAQHSGVFSDQV